MNRSTSAAFTYDGMEYVCYFQEIGCRRFLCVLEVFLVLPLVLCILFFWFKSNLYIFGNQGGTMENYV